jgi:hypothetical protein
MEINNKLDEKQILFTKTENMLLNEISKNQSLSNDF